uniref:Family with sequence similarity 107 member A n=1 Tax=Terrapene triunguis TaxID=2587831 RepID=A0A674K4L1_9SAUR
EAVPRTYLAAGSNNGLIEPKKLPNPVRESKTHQELHRELLFSHRRGLLPEHKPELQKVLETRRFKQLKQQQESQRPLTDLEEELRKRHRMLEQVLSLLSKATNWGEHLPQTRLFSAVRGRLGRGDSQ